MRASITSSPFSSISPASSDIFFPLRTLLLPCSFKPNSRGSDPLFISRSIIHRDCLPFRRRHQSCSFGFTRPNSVWDLRTPFSQGLRQAHREIVQFVTGLDAIVLAAFGLAESTGSKNLKATATPVCRCDWKSDATSYIWLNLVGVEIHYIA